MKPNQNADQKILNFENAVSVEKLEERLEMTSLAEDESTCSNTYECKGIVNL
jgi:hypothetical protein